MSKISADSPITKSPTQDLPYFGRRIPFVRRKRKKHKIHILRTNFIG